MYRQSVHRDKNHKAIVEALRKAGMRVFDTAALGSGFPDVVAVRPDGRVFLVEIKSQTKDINASGASKIKNEVEFMLKLVPEEYRIFDDPESAVEAMADIETIQSLRRDLEMYRSEVERMKATSGHNTSL